jgi:hypothetical protein
MILSTEKDGIIPPSRVTVTSSARNNILDRRYIRMRHARLFLNYSFLFLLVLLPSFLLAAPRKSISYQGSIKQNGVPVNGYYPIELRITDANGNSYWSSGSVSTSVVEGLYRMDIDPITVDWPNVTPYIETRINNIPFGPREKIASVPYSYVADRAETVKDGSIAPASINISSFQAAGIGIVPQGGILMFLDACPAGYSEVTALRNRFPIGADIGRTNSLVPDSPNATLGSLGHQHTIAHSHTTGTQGGFTGSQDIRTAGAWVSFSTPKLVSGYDAAGSGDNIGMRGVDHTHSTGQPSIASSGSTDTLPPGLTVLFCKKN